MDLMTKLAIGLGIMMGVVWLLIRNQPRREPQAPPPEPTPTARTLEEKLERLASIGWTLAPGITIDDLLHSFARPDYEQEGYDLLLVAMGSETEDERELVRCERVFHLDTECIEDDGDYVRLAERMAGMAAPDLVLEDLRDHVDIDGEEIWVSFTHRGKAHRWTLAVDDDWADPGFFSRFVKLLGKTDSQRVYVYFDLGGQDCILGCVERDRLPALERLIPGIEPLH